MQKRFWIISGLGICFFFLFLIVCWLIQNNVLSFPCLFYHLTGFYCPGCGMTRAVFALMHFQLEEAFHNNALIYLLLPLFLFYGLRFISHYIKSGKLLSIQDVYSQNTLFLILGIVVLFGLLRNLPSFDFLKPIM